MTETRVVRMLPQAARERFQSLLELSEEKLRAINAWAKDHLVEVFADEEHSLAELKSAPTKIGVSDSELAHAVSFLGTALLSGDPPGSVKVERFISELQEMGLTTNVAKKAKVLLNGIALERKQAEYIRQKGLALQSVVSTLESADALCDLRAIFLRLPSPSPSETHKESIKVLLGFEPVVLVSFNLNDAAGNDAAYSFQVTERGLRHLLKTLQEALVQVKKVTERRDALDALVSGEEVS